jgi:hypothetical protein
MLLSSISRQGRLLLNRKGTSPIPEPIMELQRQLEQFRSNQPRRTRLPESMWEAAVELARQHGVYPVAQPLRLDYMGLKKRLGGDPDLEKKATAPTLSKPTTPAVSKATVPAFIELMGSHPATLAECVIDFESSLGGKMRIQWKASAPLDWAGLLRAWRDAER